jgi:16S rRNA processing protein RimM
MRPDRIQLGVIGRPHGVRGLVHVTSYTDPPEAIASYGLLSDDTGRQFALRWLSDGLAEIAEAAGDTTRKLTDRATVEQLTNRPLYISRERLPQPEDDEFYLADLMGLTAADPSGRNLGTVVAVHDYGAGASLEIVENDLPPLLVPFTRAAVPSVQIQAGRITVDPPTIVDNDHLSRARERSVREANRVRASSP